MGEASAPARRVVTGALEVQRTAKVIGASLEAAPVVHVADTAMLAALKSVDFADLCITSGISLSDDPEPQEAFRLPEVPGVAWSSRRPRARSASAAGRSCRTWAATSIRGRASAALTHWGSKPARLWVEALRRGRCPVALVP